MKKRSLLFDFFAVAILGAILVVTIASLKNSDIAYQRQYQERDALLSYQSSMGARGAADFLATMRNNQITGVINIEDVNKARKAIDQMSTKAALNLNWSELGPDNIGGRTRALLVDANNPSTIYAGGVAGGLWVCNLTGSGANWSKCNGFDECLAISCIAQSPNGDIYVGTGESFAPGGGAANGGTGFLGGGIYRSTDGLNFSVLPSTVPVSSNTTSGNWIYINELAVNSDGRVYAATNRGIRMSDNDGLTWIDPISRSLISEDIQIADDGEVICVVGNTIYQSATGNDGSFTAVTGTGLPVSFGRCEIAYAPSNSDYIYLGVSDNAGALEGIFKSTDGGATWTTIGPSGSALFQPYGTQGGYDNAIAVFPNDPNHIIVGGLDLWEWSQGSTWTQKTMWALDRTSAYYVHADQHAYVFDPTNPNIVYLATDGGVSFSTDGAQTFATLNRNYNTIQFYGISCSNDGAILGGTQDNGTLYIGRDGTSSTLMNAAEAMGGDGGWTCFSNIAPSVCYATTYYGNIGRSFDNAAIFSERAVSSISQDNAFFDDRLNSEGGSNIGESSAFAGFVTPMTIWESINNIHSKDSMDFVAYQDYPVGSIIVAQSSKHFGYPFNYTLQSKLDSAETVRIQIPITSNFFFGGKNAVWMTRGGLDFSGAPTWYKIATLPNTAAVTNQCITASEDGDHLFVGTSEGQVYRISGLLDNYDTLCEETSNAYNLTVNQLNGGGIPTGQAVTSIAVDPNNADRVLVTLGNYGNTSYVYYTNNGTDSLPTFVSKQGNLPAMPVYSAIFEMNNPNIVILGTEFGIMTTSNISAGSPVWSEDNTGMEKVPVYTVKQQVGKVPYIFFDDNNDGVTDFPGVYNYGHIYIGTHGRGAFECLNYVSILESNTLKGDGEKDKNAMLKVYPNPAVNFTTVEFDLDPNKEVTVKVYNLNGSVVAQESFTTTYGMTTKKINLIGIPKGTYIIRLEAGKETAYGKVMITR